MKVEKAIKEIETELRIAFPLRTLMSAHDAYERGRVDVLRKLKSKLNLK